ncbi:MAG: OmpA family protein [Eudoraea sp.]|nr:OmpA family protein [Eudoraea sp.]MBT8210259.1 OmpA family protein [Eudoraea sp.]MBT8221932.1 OmpA family protein [Eudoraea sp.]NNK29331.1 OmpA family protein [Flavobacteriaceae bacterium]
MIKKILPVLLLSILMLNPSWAQEEPLSARDSARLKRYLKKADRKFRDISYSMSIDIYEAVLEKNQNKFMTPNMLKLVGDSYYFNAAYQKAARNYGMLIDNFGNQKEVVGPEYYFKYALCLKSLGEYEKSDEMMQRFADRSVEDNRVKNFKNAQDYLDAIAASEGRYSLADLGMDINSEYSDLSPSFYKEGLIFSSDRDTGNLARYRHTWNAMDFLDLYKINVDSTSRKKPSKFDLDPEFTTRVHESSSVFTQDGQTMYFTGNNYKDGKIIKDKQGIVRLKIYQAKLQEGEWVVADNLSINSDDYSVAHPALSPDERTLYFASDMHNPSVDSDLYSVAINADGSITGTPEPLKGTINTGARETFPFVSSEGVLYFASDGHPGLGGLDIFSAKIEQDRPQSPVENLGEPVNSKMDDFSFIIDDEKLQGYFASNREGGDGYDDIYAFKKAAKCEQTVRGTVRDKITNELLIGATIKVLNKEYEEIQTTFTDENGQYSLELDRYQLNTVMAMAEGYTSEDVFLEIGECKPPRIIDFYLERDEVTCGDDLSVLIPELRSTIYFDFDKDIIRDDAKPQIELVIAIMEKYPSLNIKLKAHTDAQGPDAYNLDLSKRRAQATVDYILANSDKISPDRLESEGYGETDLANKDCPNGVWCPDKEHEKNRRTEFIICGDE